MVTLAAVDLLESGDERQPVSVVALAGRVPPWAMAVGVALVLVAALLVAVDQRREAARPKVSVGLVDSASSTVAGVARGSLDVVLENQRDRAVDVTGIVLAAEGLRVTDVEPLVSRIGPRGRQPVRLRYLVPSCRALVLPGTLTVEADGESWRLPVVDARDRAPAGSIAFGACPPSARSADPGTPTDLGARSAGGTSERVGAGAAGSARLEIRNGGPPVRLLSVSAHVPGALFVSRLIDGGLTLDTDGLAIVSLRFSVPDCARLEKTGALLLRVERFGGVQELRLPVSARLTGSTGPRVDLRVVLDSCD